MHRLRASVTHGLFPSERMVTVDTLDGAATFFVHECHVDDEAKTVDMSGKQTKSRSLSGLSWNYNDSN